MYHFNCQLTNWVGVNAQVHHIEGQERNINKMIVTWSQSDEGLHHHNTSKMFNFVCTSVYDILVLCSHAQSKWEKGNKRMKAAIYMGGMWQTSLQNFACLPMSENVGQLWNMYQSTYLLSSSECTSSPHRGSGKEDKQVKQHDYTTSSQSDEGLHHHNTSKMFNFVRTIVYYTLVLCSHAQSKWEKGNKRRREGSYLHGWNVTNFLTKFCMFAYEWQCINNE